MVTKEFAEATTEINKILSYLPTEYVEKIPIKLRNFFQDVESKEYIPNIDPYKTLEEQKLKPKTQTLLAIIYRNYWCDEQEKKELDRILIENDKKYEAKLREKYNPDNIFNNKKEIINETDEETKIKQESVSIVKYDKNRWYKKVFEKLVNIFRKK